MTDPCAAEDTKKPGRQIGRPSAMAAEEGKEWGNAEIRKS